MPKGSKPVPVEAIGVGDVVSIHWKDQDVRRVGQGRVAHIGLFGRVHVFYSETGAEIGRYVSDALNETTAFMIEPYMPDTSRTLFEVEP